MYALGVRNLPEGPNWLYEIKLDGYRCLAGKDASGVSLAGGSLPKETI
jgi:ATP-dependent DNA ligase